MRTGFFRSIATNSFWRNREEDLDAALVAAGDSHIRLKWVNDVPTLGDDRREGHPLRRIRYYYDYPTPSVDENPLVWKVAVNAKLLGDAYADRYEICSGNHFLALPGGGDRAKQCIDAAAAEYPPRPISRRDPSIK